jgi:hypothetical protein
MPANYKDILSHLSTEVDQATLLLYLQNKLSEEKKHEVEKWMLEKRVCRRCPGWFAGDPR